MSDAVVRILLLEDSPSDAAFIRHSIAEVRGASFEVTLVECVSDAVSRLRDGTFDVGLLDLTLPDSSGAETYVRIQKAAPYLPIVVFTGLSDEAIGMEAIRCGVQDYLVKGTADGMTIARVIRYAIERKQMEEKLKRSHAELDDLVQKRTAKLLDINQALDTEIIIRKKAEEELRMHRDQLETLVEERSKDLRESEKRLQLLYDEVSLANASLTESRSAAVALMNNAIAAGQELETVNAKLRESEERLNRAQEIARLGSWELDLITNRIHWSDEVYRIFGKAPQEMTVTYEIFLDMVHPDDRVRVDAAYSGSIREGRDSYQVEHRILQKSGEISTVLEKCRHIRDESGRIIRSAGMVQDITGIKAAQEIIARQGRVQKGINRIFREVMWVDTEEELGAACLATALFVTDSKIGFIGRVGTDGLFHDMAIIGTEMDCGMIDGTGHRKPPANLIIRGLYGRVLTEGIGLFFNSPSSHPDRTGIPEGHPPLSAFLGVPLKHEDRVYGMIAVANRDGGYCAEDKENLEALAPTIMQTILHKQAERALRQSVSHFELLAKTAGELLHAQNSRDAVESLCREVMQKLDCQVFINFLVDENTNRLRLNAYAGLSDEDAKRIEWLDLGVSVCGCVARDGCRIVSEHIPTIPDERTDLVRSFGLMAYASHPMFGTGGKSIGTLAFGARNRETFTEDELSLMKAITDQAAVAMLRLKDEDDLRRAKDELESRVFERTAELEVVNERLVCELNDRKIAEEKARLLEINLQHAEKMKSLGILVAGIAHEINNPNQYIITSLSLLNDAWASIEPILIEYYRNNGDFLIAGLSFGERAATIREMFEKTVQSSWKIKSIVESLKGYSRKEPSLLAEAVDVNLVIDNALSLIEGSLKKTTAGIIMDRDGRLPAVRGNRLQIEQVMVNIITNAYQALIHPDQHIYLTTKLDNAGNVQIIVRDEGRGFTDEELGNVMTPFFTTKRESGGMGLGLFISSAIVKEHRGTIAFSSEAGKGTMVQISLPAAR